MSGNHNLRSSKNTNAYTGGSGRDYDTSGSSSSGSIKNSGSSNNLGGNKGGNRKNKQNRQSSNNHFGGSQFGGSKITGYDELSQVIMESERSHIEARNQMDGSGDDASNTRDLARHGQSRTSFDDGSRNEVADEAHEEDADGFINEFVATVNALEDEYDSESSEEYPHEDYAEPEQPRGSDSLLRYDREKEVSDFVVNDRAELLANALSVTESSPVIISSAEKQTKPKPESEPAQVDEEKKVSPLSEIQRALRAYKEVKNELAAYEKIPQMGHPKMAPLFNSIGKVDEKTLESIIGMCDSESSEERNTVPVHENLNILTTLGSLGKLHGQFLRGDGELTSYDAMERNVGKFFKCMRELYPDSIPSEFVDLFGEFAEGFIGLVAIGLEKKYGGRDDGGEHM